MGNKQRAYCTWPMSEFYVFEDEIPDDVRISTSKDCEKCEAIMCLGEVKEHEDCRHCLITE